MSERTRAERRHNDVKKAIRKRKLAKEVYYSSPMGSWEWFDNLHQYSKNKIHCSCPICSRKSNNRNRWGDHYDPPISDRKKIDGMNYGIDEEME